jgi:hypothetical protein
VRGLAATTRMREDACWQMSPRATSATRVVNIAAALIADAGVVNAER